MKAYVQDGDVGCGKPGSLSWHKCAIAEMTNAERLDYLKAVFDDMANDDKLAFTVFLIAEIIDNGNRS